MQNSAQTSCFVSPAPVVQPTPTKLKLLSGVRKSLKIASSSKTRPVNGILPTTTTNSTNEKLPENENFAGMHK